MFIWHFFHNKIGKYTNKNDKGHLFICLKYSEKASLIYLPLHTTAAIEHREEKTPRRRITVTSSTNEISADQLGNRIAMRGGGGF